MYADKMAFWPSSHGDPETDDADIAADAVADLRRQIEVCFRRNDELFVVNARLEQVVASHETRIKALEAKLGTPSSSAPAACAQFVDDVLKTSKVDDEIVVDIDGRIGTAPTISVYVDPGQAGIDMAAIINHHLGIRTNFMLHATIGGAQQSLN